MRHFPKIFRAGKAYAIVIPRELVNKFDLDNEPHLLLEEDNDGENLFHVRKVDNDH
jgi:antitoxin component of MazEF toxin-antitoxin module